MKEFKTGDRVRFTKKYAVGSYWDERLGAIAGGRIGTIIVADFGENLWWIQLDEAWVGYDRLYWEQEEWPERSVEITGEMMDEYLDILPE